MRSSRLWPLACAAGLLGGLSGGPAAAQDAARGAALYLQLHGGQPSCVECHGPDPLGNRNRLLNAAGGPLVLSQAIARVAAMGYLAGLLDERDRSDLSAYLARVNTLDGAAVVMWPRVLEFGRVGSGAAVPPQPLRLLNAGTQAAAVQPSLAAVGAAPGLGLAHDCPPQLAPGAVCTARVSLLSAEAGRRSAALQWQGDADALPQWVGVTASVEATAAGVLVADLPGSALQLQAAPGQAAVAELGLVNAGVAPLSLGVPAITGPGAAAFSLNGSACSAGAVLQPGERCTARITATAPLAGQRQALLQWRSDGAHLAPLELAVVAAGDAPPAPTPSPPPAPAPSPVSPPVQSPAPSPSPAPDAGGAAGGCAVAWPGQGVDPLLPGLVLLAALVLRRRALSRYFHCRCLR